jgi:hypothetical protein
VGLNEQVRLERADGGHIAVVDSRLCAWSAWATALESKSPLNFRLFDVSATLAVLRPDCYLLCLAF